MKILNELPDKGKGGMTEIYDWKTWFDGQVRLLESGIDFVVPTVSMKANIYAAAKRHNVKVTVRPMNGDLAIQKQGDV
jgi:hypothetical protein